MAKMKHSKQSVKAPRPPQVPMGRDRAFRAALAREYGVEQLPNRLQRRTARTLEALPDTLPVRQRPVLRAVRSAATVFAVLAVTFVALLGVNTTHPQLTEALPGLGMVFAAMNGNETPGPTPAPAPTPTPQPEFQPVTALSKGDFPGVLTIDSAWTDGCALILDMTISPYEDLADILGHYQDKDPYAYLILHASGLEYSEDGFEYLNQNCVLRVNTGNASGYRDYEGALDAFRPAGDGAFTSRWQLSLDSLTVDQELEVILSFPDFTLSCNSNEDETLYSWSSGFESTFTVPVSTGKNRQFSVQAVDGPVTLRSVHYTPSRVELDVTLSYLGLTGDLLLEEMGGEFNQLPLGSPAELTCMDGEFIYEHFSLNSPDFDMAKQLPSDAAELNLHYTFSVPNIEGSPHPKDLKGPLTVTFYEVPESPNLQRRVVAEFTIDLSTGRASPSESYLERGCEKSDPYKTAAQRLEEAQIDGLILLPDRNSIDAFQGIFGPYVEFTLAAPVDQESRYLTVNGYLKDDLIESFSFLLGDHYFEDYNGSCSIGYFELPSSGEEYLETTVTLNFPYDEPSIPLFDRLELVDADTGEVITPDIEASWHETVQILLGSRQDVSETEYDIPSAK